MRTSAVAAWVLCGAVLLGACATAIGRAADEAEPPTSAPTQAGDGAPPALGMCLPEAPDCVDVMIETREAFDVDTARASARALLGVTEDELPDDVRVGRRGDGQMLITQDHVPGRLTVELDSSPDGYRVTSVTVELPEGPETFTG